jgi:hypothetical protein
MPTQNVRTQLEAIHVFAIMGMQGMGCRAERMIWTNVPVLCTIVIETLCAQICQLSKGNSIAAAIQATLEMAGLAPISTNALRALLIALWQQAAQILMVVSNAVVTKATQEMEFCV